MLYAPILHHMFHKKQICEWKEFRMEIGNNGIPDIFVCQFVNMNFEIIKIKYKSLPTVEIGE